MKKKLLGIIFYFDLYGFVGGIKFAWGLFSSGVERIYVFSLGSDELNRIMVNPQLRFKWVKNVDQFDDISKYFSGMRAGCLLIEEARERLLSGKQSLGAVFKEDDLVGWGWVRYGPVKYGNSELSEEDGVIHKCRTIRSCRRQRVYATLLVKVLQQLRNDNKGRILIGAKQFNAASLKAIEKVGFRFVEDYDAGSFFVRMLSHFYGRGTKVMSND